MAFFRISHSESDERQTSSDDKIAEIIEMLRFFGSEVGSISGNVMDLADRYRDSGLEDISDSLKKIADTISEKFPA